VTIHSDHPFAVPDDDVRRLRGRLGGAVALLTSGSGSDRAGLTVSSLMIANGEPGRLLALLDPDSSLAETVEQTGRAICHLLSHRHQALAEAFAGQLPAPGGPFRTADFEDGDYGPRLLDVATFAELAKESASEVGWSQLVVFRLVRVVIGADEAALEHRRGRYRALGSES
jgi:flavin reductase (DIM6/NTAB) family NADH-FMN oxidoreductase RutF